MYLFLSIHIIREAEAEELAAQLALLLDEERQEEDAIRLDEQLARKLAEEDDETIAREQQDRELARMLQAKERIRVRIEISISLAIIVRCWSEVLKRRSSYGA